jgi:tetratricopeptide (TPR) repeat protein
LSLGVAAYEKFHFEEAIKYLEHVVLIDPKSIAGHLYLGRSYDDWQCATPNGCDPHWSARAIQEYGKVLELDPTNKDALKCMAYLLYRLAQFDEAEGFYRKAAKLDGEDAEARYSIAVLDFRRAWPVLMAEKVRLHLAREQPLIDLRSCAQVRAKTLGDVEEGLALLSGTAKLTNSLDAQTYLAVLYRTRAELQCGDRSAYERDLKAEGQWWNRACVTFHAPKRDSSPPRWIAGQGPPPPRREDQCKWW